MLLGVIEFWLFYWKGQKLLFIFFLIHVADGILVLHSGMESVPPTV